MSHDATVLQATSLRLAGSGAPYRDAFCEMLDEADEVMDVILATHDPAGEVLHTGERLFDFPAPMIASKNSGILCERLVSINSVEDQSPTTGSLCGATVSTQGRAENRPGF